MKDSGKRMVQEETGFVREPDTDREDLTWLAYDGVDLLPGDLIYRLGALYQAGGAKYSARNWEAARGSSAYARGRRAAVRHFRAWLRGEADEDHLAAVVFNMYFCDYVKFMTNKDGAGAGSVDALYHDYPNGTVED